MKKMFLWYTLNILIAFPLIISIIGCEPLPGKKARGLIKEGEYEQAIRVLEQAEVERPDWEERNISPDDAYSLGVLYLYRASKDEFYSWSTLGKATDYFALVSERKSEWLNTVQPLIEGYLADMPLPTNYLGEAGLESYYYNLYSFYRERGDFRRLIGDLEGAVREYELMVIFIRDDLDDDGLMHNLKYIDYMQVLGELNRDEEAEEIIKDLETKYGTDSTKLLRFQFEYTQSERQTKE